MPRAPRAQRHNRSDQDGQSSDEDDNDDDEAGEMEVETAIAEQVGEFEEIVVWGHGGVVEEAGDVYVRGLREWVGFAESMHTL